MENGLLFKELLQTPNFRITVVDDADTVELCGALKVRLTGCRWYTDETVILVEKKEGISIEKKKFIIFYIIYKTAT